MKLDDALLAPFAAEAEARAVDRMTRLLMAYFPDAKELGFTALRLGVVRRLARAYHLGLDGEAHAAQYVIASWVLGADFDERFPEARRVLHTNAYTPDARAAWLQAWPPAVLDGLEED